MRSSGLPRTDVFITTKMRSREPDLPRPYRAFGYPVLPALYVLASAMILWLGVTGWPAGAQQHSHPAPAADRIGQVSFSISCAPATQRPFERAVALLHSFWYLEAVKGFTEVTRLDPDPHRPAGVRLACQDPPGRCHQRAR